MIDTDLFAGAPAPDPELLAALAAACPQLASVGAEALLASASYSERYLARRGAQQLAEQAAATLCAALGRAHEQSPMAALENLGRELALAGLLREALAQLLVAWHDAALAVVIAAGPAERQADWLLAAAALLARALAAVQAGHEEGRRLRILEQQEGMRQALAAALAEREGHERHLLDLITAISTPVVPLLAGILVLPLIGAIDSRRAQQITEQILQSIEREHASIIIIDITGVSTVDTQTAQVLLQAAQAARLLGAEAVLVGITPEVAQTVVGLGLSLQGIFTFADLRAGVTYALKRRGLQLVPRA